MAAGKEIPMPTSTKNPQISLLNTTKQSLNFAIIWELFKQSNQNTTSRSPSPILLVEFLKSSPSNGNAYGGMHGGAVGAVAERVAIACARTVVGKEKDLFLGELSISYLSAAPHNIEVVIDGSVVRSGRNLTVVAVNFRLKESGKLAFLTRATFYNMPVSSL